VKAPTVPTGLDQRGPASEIPRTHTGVSIRTRVRLAHVGVTIAQQGNLVCYTFIFRQLLNMGHLRLCLGVGLSLLVMLATLAVVATVRNHSDTSELIQALGVVITITATASAWLWKRAHPTKVRQLPLDQAANELAEELRRQWERAAAEQGLIVPAPIPIKWNWSTRGVGGPSEKVLGRGQVLSRFAPLPGVTTVTTIRGHWSLTAGRPSELHDARYPFGGFG
jgi:hypothetical protein